MELQDPDILSTISSMLLPTISQSILAPSSSTPSVFPSELTNPLFPRMLQEQINYNVLQQLIATFVSSSIASTNTANEEKEEKKSNINNQISVPNDDKEGWCRNKKYIEKTSDGNFMCLVCKKIYGRYNSVSYHVTIYHRNPPVKCDIEGCDFSTREARYIHFHKHYRHGMILPRNIDQGTRRCSICNHISKSPAMLEKHMKKHLSSMSALKSVKTEEIFMTNVKREEEENRHRSISTSQSMEIDEDQQEQEFKLRSFTL